MGAALVAVGTIIGIVVVQSIIDSFAQVNTTSGNPTGLLLNVGAGTYALVGLFVLLIAVVAIITLLKLAF